MNVATITISPDEAATKLRAYRELPIERRTPAAP